MTKARKDEQKWTKEHLIPRLQQLGFEAVDLVHGPMEAGRDLVFADTDRFGIRHYYAAQVKDGSLRARSETKELGGIIQQLTFAYETPYVDPATGSSNRIRGVYLVVNGEVSVPARQILAHRLGQWVHIIDRRHLDLAGSFISHINNEERRSRIVALKLELMFEKEQLPLLKKNAQAALDASETTSVHLLSRPMRTKALDRYLEVAFEELAPLDAAVLHNLRDAADILNFIVARLPLGPMDQVIIKPTFESLLMIAKVLEKEIPIARDLLDYVLSQRRPAVGQSLEPWPGNPNIEAGDG